MTTGTATTRSWTATTTSASPTFPSRAVRRDSRTATPCSLHWPRTAAPHQRWRSLRRARPSTACRPAARDARGPTSAASLGHSSRSATPGRSSSSRPPRRPPAVAAAPLLPQPLRPPVSVRPRSRSAKRRRRARRRARNARRRRTSSPSSVGAVTKVFPQLGYSDPKRAIAWLEALGFELLLTWPYPDGSIRHAELRLGDAIVMVGGALEDLQQPELRGRTVGHGTYVQTDDVRAMYTAAIDAGGTPGFDPPRPR